MGWFKKQVFGTCRVCGMEEVVAGKCGYCGQSQTPSKTASEKARSSFKRARPDFSRNVDLPKIDQVHSHTDSHEIPSNKNPQMNINKPKKPQVAPKPAPASKKKSASQKGKGASRFFYFVSIVAWFFCFGLVAESFDRTSGRVSELGNEGGLFLGLAAFFLLIFTRGGIFRTILSLMTVPMTAVLLLAKPAAAPVKYYYNQQWTAFSYSSETHMYFVVPGVILIFCCFIFGLSILVRMLRWIFKSN